MIEITICSYQERKKNVTLDLILLEKWSLLGIGQRKKETEHVFIEHLLCPKTSLVAQTVKRLPTMREPQFQSLGGEDLLEKEMATHSSVLAC